MTERRSQRAATRAKLLAELEQALKRAQYDADTLAADPDCKAEVRLLAAKLDRIAAEVERIRLGQSAASRKSVGSERRPPNWRPATNGRTED